MCVVHFILTYGLLGFGSFDLLADWFGSVAHFRPFFNASQGPVCKSAMKANEMTPRIGSAKQSSQETLPPILAATGSKFHFRGLSCTLK